MLVSTVKIQAGVLLHSREEQAPAPCGLPAALSPAGQGVQKPCDSSTGPRAEGQLSMLPTDAQFCVGSGRGEQLLSRKSGLISLRLPVLIKQWGVLQFCRLSP